jgi:hypothetical protein
MEIYAEYGIRRQFHQQVAQSFAPILKVLRLANSACLPSFHCWTGLK